MEKKVRMELIFVITPGALFGLPTEYFVSNIWDQTLVPFHKVSNHETDLKH